ncbi:MAG TPA: condensation domain-containing protein, partial [Anaerolineales bacterium]|nr:condensation domain-containing protein [Anaerolineales bacterium]
RTVDAGVLERAFEALFRHHDALRARFEQTPDGWRQSIADAQPIEGILRKIDLSALSSDERVVRLSIVNGEAQTSLDIHRSPLLRAVLFEADASAPQKLLIIAHHLAVDFVSWQILIHDLWMAYAQLESGAEVRLPEKTASFKAWAEWLSEQACSETVKDELNYWTAISERVVQSLPMDRPENRNRNRVADAGSVVVELSAADTESLLRNAQRAYHAQVSEILLTALADVFFKWTGHATLLIDLEGHGRESETLDVSRTIGWFTSLFPVCLQVESNDPAARVQAVKEQVRRIPQKGMGYGLLRYLNRETAPLLAGLPRAEVIFNYGGQLRTVHVKALGGERADDEDLGYLFNISGAVVEDRLVFSWEYSREIYARETVELLAGQYLRALQNLIAHCSSIALDGYRPDDFPLAALSQSELDAVIEDAVDVADIGPLSPMQSVILEQSLAAPESGIYVTQTGFEIWQYLDPARFKQVWKQVIERHEIFRTRFAWKNLKQPLQIVHDEAIQIWEEQDWRGISLNERRETLNELLDRERQSGFNLLQLPLLRFTLIRLEDDVYQFFWHCHHLLMDGWSYPIIFREVAEFYSDPAAYLPEPHPYREYIGWLARQDLLQAESFWRETLAGFLSPSLLPGQRTDSGSSAPRYREEGIPLIILAGKEYG